MNLINHLMSETVKLISFIKCVCVLITLEPQGRFLLFSMLSKKRNTKSITIKYLFCHYISQVYTLHINDLFDESDLN